MRDWECCGLRSAGKVSSSSPFDFLAPSSPTDIQPSSSRRSACPPHPSSSSSTTLTGKQPQMASDLARTRPGAQASELTIVHSRALACSGRSSTRTRTDTCSSACPPRSGESSRRSRTRETCSTPTSCESTDRPLTPGPKRTKRRELTSVSSLATPSAFASAHSVKKLQATVGSTRQEIEDALRSLPVVSLSTACSALQPRSDDPARTESERSLAPPYRPSTPDSTALLFCFGPRMLTNLRSRSPCSTPP